MMLFFPVTCKGSYAALDGSKKQFLKLFYPLISKLDLSSFMPTLALMSSFEYANARPTNPPKSQYSEASACSFEEGRVKEKLDSKNKTRV